MNRVLKSLMYASAFYRILSPIKRRIEWLWWLLRGKPIPLPSIAKQKVIMYYAKRCKISTLIETGTYLGDMAYSVRNIFSKIVTIEIDRKLFLSAIKRLNKYPQILLECGDSGQVLKRILKSIKSPVLFWLDAHFSGGITSQGNFQTPIMEEIGAIFEHSQAGHIILVDDARCFTGENGYPTISEIYERIKVISPELLFEIKEDIIRIHK